MNKILRINILLFLGLIIFSCSKIDYVEIVKNGELKDYPGKKIGVTLENFMGPCTWEHFRNKDEGNYVKVNGVLVLDDESYKLAFKFKIISGLELELESIWELDGIEKENKELLNDLLHSAFIEENFSVNR